MSDKKLVLPGEFRPQDAVTEAAAEKTYSKTQNRLQAQPEEVQKEVLERASQIVINRATTLSYGKDVQSKFKDLVDVSLRTVVSKDSTKRVADFLNEMSAIIKDYNDAIIDSQHSSPLRSVRYKTTVLRMRCDSVLEKVIQIAKALESEQPNLLSDIDTLEDLCQQNLKYYNELSLWIESGRLKLQQVRSNELAQLERRGNAMLYRDLESVCARFDERLASLELTSTICLQIFEQVRLVQDIDVRLVESIECSIINSIAAWRQDMSLIDTLERSQTATMAYREALDINAAEISNDRLLLAIKDVIGIQENGSKMRHELEERFKNANSNLPR